MSRWDAVRFLHDYAVPYVTTGAHTSAGWVNINCPLCHDTDSHGGFNPEKGYYHCWHCGGVPLDRVVRLLVGGSRDDAEKIVREYLGTNSHARDGVVRKAGATRLVLPGTPLGKFHRKYLRKRGFDPDVLERTYGLLGTGPGERFHGVDYSLRIIIPLHDMTGRLISFQGRDITGKDELRYKGCSVEHSLQHYKETLYGAHLSLKRKRIAVVEGVFDQWRLGIGSVATFGTSLMPQQVRALAHWEEIVFLFDSEGPAQAKAVEYARQLAALGRNVEVAELQGLGGKDPGDLSEEEAAELRADLRIFR